MRDTQAIIERVRRISADLQRLELSVDHSLAQLQPGQSVFARLLETVDCHTYLREQWIPVDVRSGQLLVEIPTNPSYAPGRVVSLLAPVGQAIPLRSGVGKLLMIAEDALPTPLNYPAHHLIESGIAVTLVLNGRAADYPLELFPPEVEILRGDIDWKWPDQVETLIWADQVIALAPSYSRRQTYSSLLHVVTQIRHHDLPENYLCGLFYQRLACGTGACQACQIAYRGADRLACTDGPAFDLKRVVLE